MPETEQKLPDVVLKARTARGKADKARRDNRPEEASRILMEQAPPHVLWAEASGNRDDYFHAMNEAGHLVERDTDLPPTTCPICGHHFE